MQIFTEVLGWFFFCVSAVFLMRTVAFHALSKAKLYKWEFVAFFAQIFIFLISSVLLWAWYSLSIAHLW